MELSASLRKRLEHFDLDISCSCPEEELLTIIGPSGSGKTTIMRMLAGLEKPDSGRITYQDETWFDAARGINLPPQKRRLGYVSQEYPLFPHLSLYDNATFNAADRKVVEELFELFDIGHLRNSKPHMVSGGERQRCAICQALATQPRVLLLDEPFSALDVMTRRKIREQLQELKKTLTIPMIYVTHDIAEALLLADSILPVVAGNLDKGWMQRMVAREPLPDGFPKIIKTTAAALSYGNG